MRKMVIHFGPNSEGSGTQKHEIRYVDPAHSVETASVDARKQHTYQPVAIEEALSWRSLMSRKLADKVRKAERVIEGVTMGMAILKSVKGMSRRKKAVTGALVVAGIAGVTYLRMRSKRR